MVLPSRTDILEGQWKEIIYKNFERSWSLKEISHNNDILPEYKRTKKIDREWSCKFLETIEPEVDFLTSTSLSGLTLTSSLLAQHYDNTKNCHWSAQAKIHKVTDSHYTCYFCVLDLSELRFFWKLKLLFLDVLFNGLKWNLYYKQEMSKEY